MVLTALHRPNKNTIGAFRLRYPKESGSPLASYVITLVNAKER
jgi:hypothetical protein